MAALSFVIGAADLASAEVRHRHYHARAHHIYARRLDGSSKSLGRMTPEPAQLYQTYASHESPGYGGVPENPLIPVRPVIPPPISHSGLPCYSLDDCDRKDYDESGTRGRLGLGASPYHPEGPGNPR
jgi:hypothetical protein